MAKKITKLLGITSIALITAKSLSIISGDEFVDYKYFFEKKILQLHSAPIKKPKVIILGTGWGALSFLSAVDKDNLDITIISPRSFFFYTPLLAGVATGTISHSSIIESIRFFFNDSDSIRFVQGKFLPIKITLLTKFVR